MSRPCFVCPMCGGDHFGTNSEDGTILEYVCHGSDEREGCGWRGPATQCLISQETADHLVDELWGQQRKSLAEMRIGMMGSNLSTILRMNLMKRILIREGYEDLVDALVESADPVITFLSAHFDQDEMEAVINESAKEVMDRIVDVTDKIEEMVNGPQGEGDVDVKEEINRNAVALETVRQKMIHYVKGGE